MVDVLGGAVESSDHREFGRATVQGRSRIARLFDGVWRPGESHQVWMSHGDRVISLPAGFRVVGTSEGAPFAAVADEDRRFYGVQFHPEVVHTPSGAQLLRNFTHLHRRLRRRLVDGGVSRAGARTHPRAGRPRKA